MPENTLLDFAQSNPSAEQIENFILLHPELDAIDVEGLRAARDAQKYPLPISVELFRAVNEV